MHFRNRDGHLVFIALSLVILSGMIHAVWNLFAKRSVNKVVFLWFCQCAAILLYFPLAMRSFASIHHPIQPNGWLLLCVAACSHGIYVLLLAKTYTAGDFSQAYPVMRGTSPLLVPLIGVLFLGEQLSMTGWLGVLSIVVGIWTIGGFRFSNMVKSQDCTVLWAMSVGLTITAYTLLDKLTLQYFPPVALNEVSNIGNLLSLSWIAVSSRALSEEWRTNWKTIVMGGIMAPGGYILFLSAMSIMPVARIAPMREVSTVFGTLLGVFVLREGNGKRRFVASAMIVIGIICLA